MTAAGVMHELVAELMGARQSLDELVARVYEIHYKIGVLLQRGELSTEDLVDAGFLNRRMELASDELRKECAARCSTISKMLGVTLIKHHFESGRLPRGRLATASPRISVHPDIPSRGSPEYLELMKFMGVSGIGLDRSLIGIHYKALMDYLQERADTGQPTPKWVGQREVATCTYRELKRRDDKPRTDSSHQSSAGVADPGTCRL